MEVISTCVRFFGHQAQLDRPRKLAEAAGEVDWRENEYRPIEGSDYLPAVATGALTAG